MNPYTQTFDNSILRPAQYQPGDLTLGSELASQNQQILARMAEMTPQQQQQQNQFAKPIGSLYVPGYASPGASNMNGRPALGAFPPPPSSGTRSRPSVLDRLASFGQQPQSQQQQQQPQSSGWSSLFDGGKSYRRKARKAAKKSRKARKSAKKSRRSSRR